MSPSLLRQLALLSAIPRHPANLTARQLHTRLAAQGFEVTLRTVQKDLTALRTALGLERSGKPHEYAWSWPREKPSMLLGGMSAEAAMSFRLMAGQVEHLMPPEALVHLRPHLEAAERALAGRRKHSAWARKVRVLPKGLPLTVPRTVSDALNAVYAALFEDTQCEIAYAPENRPLPWRRTVNPLGLVFRGAAGYLACTYAVGTDARLRGLHLARIREARKLETAVVRPSGFDLGVAVALGEFGFRLSEAPVKVSFRVRKAVGAFLRHEHLAVGQTLVEEDGWLRITATVPDTADLRRFLIGLGADAEVLGPARLRAEVAEAHRTAAARYGGMLPCEHSLRTP